MNRFIEVHDTRFDRVVSVNPNAIAEYSDHYILVDGAHSIETKESYDEIKALIAAEYTTVALEQRGGEHKPTCEHRKGPIKGGIVNCSNHPPNPTPATVERYRTKIGEVVAMPCGSEMMIIVLPSGASIELPNLGYAALVKHQTDLGVWVKIDE